MEAAIIVYSFAVVGALFVAVIAALAYRAVAEKLSNTNARLRGSNAELLKACRSVAQYAERKNTITDRWDCKICGTLIGDKYHHRKCPVNVVRSAIAKAEES